MGEGGDIRACGGERDTTPETGVAIAAHIGYAYVVGGHRGEQIVEIVGGVNRVVGDHGGVGPRLGGSLVLQEVGAVVLGNTPGDGGIGGRDTRDGRQIHGVTGDVAGYHLEFHVGAVALCIDCPAVGRQIVGVRVRAVAVERNDRVGSAGIIEILSAVATRVFVHGYHQVACAVPEEGGV